MGFFHNLKKNEIMSTMTYRFVNDWKIAQKIEDVQ